MMQKIGGGGGVVEVISRDQIGGPNLAFDEGGGAEEKNLRYGAGF